MLSSALPNTNAEKSILHGVNILQFLIKLPLSILGQPLFQFSICHQNSNSTATHSFRKASFLKHILVFTFLRVCCCQQHTSVQAYYRIISTFKSRTEIAIGHCTISDKTIHFFHAFFM